MDKISFLKNPVQEYEWGSRTVLQSLLKMPVPGAKPAAELWMGVHPKGPSEVLIDGEWLPLTDVIKNNPESVLGKAVAERFQNQLPFLFKVLAADRPLSIQVHPDLVQAEEGYAKENKLGISLTAAERNYRDSNHKPEALCAVTPFEALKGFRKVEEIIALMETVCMPELQDLLDLLKKRPNSEGVKDFFSGLLQVSGEEKAKVIHRAVGRAERYLDRDRAFYWMVELSKEYPGDTGLFSPLIFNLLTLQPGQAIYIPAGELHGYLKGVGIELMANSDNVLRGGLTPKHVDVPELLKIVNFDPGPPLLISPEDRGNGERIYPTPAEEFQLSEILVREESTFVSAVDRNVEILICMDGEARMENRAGDLSLQVVSGESVIIPACAEPYRIQGNAEFFKATV